MRTGSTVTPDAALAMMLPFVFSGEVAMVGSLVRAVVAVVEPFVTRLGSMSVDHALKPCVAEMLSFTDPACL